MKVFFRGPRWRNSWTPGPKPLCHRHPTGPHPSGLLWTPKGDSTKRNFALAAGLQPRDLFLQLLDARDQLVDAGRDLGLAVARHDVLGAVDVPCLEREHHRALRL